MTAKMSRTATLFRTTDMARNSVPVRLHYVLMFPFGMPAAGRTRSQDYVARLRDISPDHATKSKMAGVLLIESFDCLYFTNLRWSSEHASSKSVCSRCDTRNKQTTVKRRAELNHCVADDAGANDAFPGVQLGRRIVRRWTTSYVQASASLVVTVTW